MYTIGIDLGTTLSRVAVLDDKGRPEIMENAEGELMTPSVVYFGEEGVIVGREAVVAGRDNPERVVRYAKRWLGDSQVNWEIDGTFYSPVDISSFILRKLRDDFVRIRGPVSRAVISVPAHFDANQRRLTMEAALQADITQVDLVNEPVASALMFVIGESIEAQALAADQTLVVYDLGGGTFDLSLVRYNDKKVSVIASTGDLQLGGIDWNERIVEQLALRFVAAHGLDFRTDRKFMTSMDERAEQAKRSLSTPNVTKQKVQIKYLGRELVTVIQRSEFEEWTRDLVERTCLLTEQLIEDGGTELVDINNLLVVGGSTRMPMIREAVKVLREDHLKGWTNPEFDPTSKISPEFAVAQGAALYGGILDNNSGGTTSAELADPRLSGFVTTIVNSHSLGILVRNEDDELINHIVIPRNTPLPAAVRLNVVTYRLSQERISLRIVEGEEKSYAKDENVVCVCSISNLPAGLPLGSVFEVSLFYEANGLLQVIAKHSESGLLATASVQRNQTTS